MWLVTILRELPVDMSFTATSAMLQIHALVLGCPSKFAKSEGQGAIRAASKLLS